MRYVPMPTQISGAEFLASRHRALLADEPRVGKTGAAIMAADKINAQRILVITTASGRPVWRRAFADWSSSPRHVIVDKAQKGDERHSGRVALIVSWAGATKLSPAFGRVFDLIILDESHAAKNPTAKRTRAVFGWINDEGRITPNSGLIVPETKVWLLSGTPMPHDPSDIWTTLVVGAPERLEGVKSYAAFRDRYCVIRKKRINQWTMIDVVVGGKNEEELKLRIGDFMLRRTQRDIGAHEPVHEIYPIIVDSKSRKAIDASPELRRVLDAIERGQQLRGDELATVIRLTGEIKAHPVAAAAAEELDNGLDRLVLAYWNRNVGDILEDALQAYGVSRVDGSTRDRDQAVNRFSDGTNRVFLAQIVAAGEAIDLSAAAELWFVQSSFTVKDMQQMAMRIVNISQKRMPVVRYCYADGSIDEAMAETVMRLSTSINKVMERV